MEEDLPFPEKEPEVNWVLFASRYLRRTGNWEGVYAIWETVAFHKRSKGKLFLPWKEFMRQVMEKNELK